MSSDGDAKHLELGAFLRAHRERLKPDQAGLPAGPRRRTPGLRREEVAQLSGLSATWYTWIEQGRELAVSVTALGNLARVLRLSAAERAHLFALAGKRDPHEAEPASDRDLSAALAALVGRIDAPAYLLDRYWNACAWNAAAERLFVGWLDAPGQRNLLRYVFLEPRARALIPDWPARAQRVLAEFRVDYRRHLHDPAMRDLIDALLAEADFARTWHAHAVMEREGGERRFVHPEHGELHFQQLGFNLADQPDCKLTVLVPAVRA